MDGPAHLDLDHNIAHKRPDCPRLLADDPVCTATAGEGPMTGFEWCQECGHADFTEETV